MKKSHVITGAFIAVAMMSSETQAETVTSKPSLLAEHNPLMNENYISAHEFYIGNFVRSVTAELMKPKNAALYLNESEEENTENVIQLLETRPSYRINVSGDVLDQTMRAFREGYGVENAGKYMVYCTSRVSETLRQQTENALLKDFGKNPFGKNGLNQLIDYVHAKQASPIYLILYVEGMEARRSGTNPSLATCNAKNRIVAEMGKPKP